MVVYDLQTFNTDNSVPYAFALYELSKLSGNYYRYIVQREYAKCRNDCIVLKGTDCINNLLKHVLEFEGEAKRNKNKNVKYKLYLPDHKVSGFDTYVVLNILPQWKKSLI